ncbi:serine O-acetyltransferase EpsC [Desulfobaculum bizertense]|uniref:serine O-acetyltransferase n=1 Tax=Desulfobaculum bizertense DSM 18034 TaxID=1121442 RepID=A0A1T4WLN1_9BACT|nr:serine O-acetyltransferase EpsC [Desulfobaculum bizertense]UIJ39470.1 serine acetyltransferase [Desulfobaculum bizertense]SKA78057.1 serine O-acetyltransferase [Desulfobaculum bizertense DSM 18034]
MGFMDNVIDQLCIPSSYEGVYHSSKRHAPMPSVETLSEIVSRLRAVLFPGYFGHAEIEPGTMRYHIGTNLDKIHRLLTEQINRGHCFLCTLDDMDCDACEQEAQDICRRFIDSLPELRRLLVTDVMAAFEGDPAAVGPGETIFCYPSITAVTNYRIAHQLQNLGVKLIPRIITEMAHSVTGIDIHPGATIGEHFFIDHGTGTVIGETCIIGNNVRLYQGVTLGAKSFPKDEEGVLVKGIARHPIVEDNVIIYSGATILGRVTIGKDAVIGGNVWLTRDVAPGSRVLQNPADNH